MSNKFIRSIFLALGIFLATATLSFAHATLIKSDPAPNSVLPISPTQITLWFDEPIDPAFTKIEVLDQNRTRFDTGTVLLAPNDRKIVRALLKDADLGAALPDGTYTVVWRVMSAADGHITLGIFAFSVGQVTSSVAASSSESISRESAPLSVFTRGVDLISILALVGTIFFLFILLTRSLRAVDADVTLADARWRQLVAIALGAAIVAQIARLILQTGNVTDVITFQTISQVLFGSRLGTLWIWRMVVLALIGFLIFRTDARIAFALSTFSFLLLAFLYYGGLGNNPSLDSILTILGAFITSWNTSGALHHLVILGSPFLIFFVYAGFRDAEAKRSVLFFLSGVLLFTVSLSGHNAAQGDFSLGVFADWLHLLAVSFWVGGLFTFIWVMTAIWRALPEEKRSAWLAWLIPQFSRVALVSVVVLSLTGVYSAINQIPSLAALAQTVYGQTLTIKVILFLIMLQMGAIHLFVTGRRFALARGNPSDLFKVFRMLIGVEVAVGIMVITLAGFMTLIPPARSAITAPGATPQEPEGPPQIILYNNPAPDVSIKLTHSSIGATQTFIAFVTDANKQPASNILRVIFEFTLLDSDVGVTRVNVDNVLQGQYGTSGNYLTLPGLWRARVIVRRKGVDDVTATFPIYVEDKQKITENDPRALDLLKQADAQMNSLSSIRASEELNDGANGVVASRYEFAAPDRLRIEISGGNESISIGTMQYFRDQGTWSASTRGDAFAFPKFNNAAFTSGVKFGRTELLNGAAMQIIETNLASSAGAVHYAYWIGNDDRLIHQYAMVAPAHYMIENYFDFNAPIKIQVPSVSVVPTPPAITSSGTEGTKGTSGTTRLPGPITGDLESDAATGVIVIGLVVALRATDKKRARLSRVISLAISLALVGTGIFLFADAINAANQQFANVPVDATQAAAGKILYEQHCLVCHGETGVGNGPAAATLKVKPFDLTVHALQHDDLYFIAVIGGGRGEMPAFRDRLNQSQILQLTAYMRQLARDAQSLQ